MQLIEQIMVPTFVLDVDGYVLIWNNACERLTGVPASEVIGTRDHWKGFYAEERPCLADLVGVGRYAELESYYRGVSDVGLTDFGVSLEVTGPMPRLGRVLSLLIDAGPIYDEAGKLTAVVQTFRDITAQKEAQSALQTLAARDSLTGLHNRRSFDASLSSELRRCQREGAPVSLLMIDIDHFKLFNDRFGHIGGDTCLQQIAEAIRVILRHGDIAARYGGEEFAVILPATARDGAELVAERLRMKVETLAISHPDTTRGMVTLSVGASTAQDPDLSPADIMSSSDEALYMSKRNGRNCVTFGEARSSSVVLF